MSDVARKTIYGLWLIGSIYTLFFFAMSVSAQESGTTQQEVLFTGTVDTRLVPPGVYNATFRLYPLAKGGTPLWTGIYSQQTNNPITIREDGNYTVVLGSGAGNTLTLPLENNIYYVSIQIDQMEESPERSMISVGGFTTTKSSDVTSKITTPSRLSQILCPAIVFIGNPFSLCTQTEEIEVTDTILYTPTEKKESHTITSINNRKEGSVFTTPPPTPEISPSEKSTAIKPATRESYAYFTYQTNDYYNLNKILDRLTKLEQADRVATNTPSVVQKIFVNKQSNRIYDNMAENITDATIAITNNGTLTNPTLSGAVSVSSLTPQALIYPSATGVLTSASGLSINNDSLTIGTTTAYEKLTVAGPVYLADTTPTTTINRLYNTGGSLYWNGVLLGGATVGTWTASGGNVYRPTGNVGIGTTSPSYKLDIAGTLNATGATTLSSTLGVTGLSTLADLTSTGTVTLSGLSQGTDNSVLVLNSSNQVVTDEIDSRVWGSTLLANIVEDTTPQLGGDLDVNGQRIVSASNGNIEIAPDGTGDFFVNTNQLYVDSSTDRVGIGTTVPGAKLDVSSGDASILNLTRSSGAGWMTFNEGSTLKTYLGFESSVGGGIIFGSLGDSTVLRSQNALHLVTAGSVTNGISIVGTNTGIGTTSPTHKLDVSGDINTTGTLRINGSALAIDNLADAQSDSTNNNLFLGGAGFSGTFYNNNNTAIGLGAFDNANIDNTQSYYGDSNVAVGGGTLSNNTTGYYNSALGYATLFSNTTGYNNTAQGRAALFSNTTGFNNSAFGMNAGRYIADGTTANATSSASLYLGANSKALASGGTNEIVIGYNATGIGSNTVVLGNDSITTTALKGNVGIGTTSPATTLQSIGSDYGSNIAGNTVYYGGGKQHGYNVFGSQYGDGACYSYGVANTICPSYKGGKAGGYFRGGNGTNYAGGGAGIVAIGGNSANNGSSAEGGAGIYAQGGLGGDGVTRAYAGYFADGDVIVNTGNVGIGTTVPSYKLDVSGDINTTGTLRVNGSALAIDNLADAQNDSTNSNLFLGGAGFSGTFYNNNNTAIGLGAFDNPNTDNTQTYFGDWNTAIGQNALTNNTTGYYNTAVGGQALYSNTTGSSNSAQGVNSLFSNTTGSSNSAQGVNSLFSNTTGSNNSAFGRDAGRYIADGTTANATSSNSLYLGAYTKALASGDTNEIVIGYNATGLGSNTVVLGNDSITTTALKGNVGIGTTAPSYKLDVAGTLNATGATTLSTTTISDLTVSGGSVNLGHVYHYIKKNATTNEYFSSGFHSFTGTSGQIARFDVSSLTSRFLGAVTVGYNVSNTPPVNGLIISGNVGIGTASPGDLLHIASGSNFPEILVEATGSAVEPGIKIKDASETWRLYLDGNDDFRIGDTGVSNIFLIQNGSPADSLTIQSDGEVIMNAGNVGIGTTAPVGRLQSTSAGASTSVPATGTIDSTTALYLTNTNTAYGLLSGVLSTGTSWLQAQRTDSTATTYNLSLNPNGGNVGIGTTTPFSKLTVAGDVYATGTIKADNLLGGATNLTTDVNGNIIRDPSDRRLKKNITNLENSLEKVLQLQGVQYQWKDEERFGTQTEIGFIAQDIDAVLPEVVRKGGDYWSINTRNILAVVVEGMKEMWNTVTGNTQKIDTLEARIEALEEQLNIQPTTSPSGGSSGNDNTGDGMDDTTGDTPSDIPGTSSSTDPLPDGTASSTNDDGSANTQDDSPSDSPNEGDDNADTTPTDSTDDTDTTDGASDTLEGGTGDIDVTNDTTIIDDDVSGDSETGDTSSDASDTTTDSDSTVGGE